MALGDCSWRIRVHSSYARASVRMSLFSVAKRARALDANLSFESVGMGRGIIRCGFVALVHRIQENRL